MSTFPRPQFTELDYPAWLKVLPNDLPATFAEWVARVDLWTRNHVQYNHKLVDAPVSLSEFADHRPKTQTRPTFLALVNFCSVKTTTR